MGLGGLNKKNILEKHENQDKQKLEELISGAPIKTSKIKGKKYVRCSYSLTQKHKDMVVTMAKKVPFKCSDSDIVKASIMLINKLSTSELIKLISSENNKI